LTIALHAASRRVQNPAAAIDRHPGNDGQRKQSIENLFAEAGAPAHGERFDTLLAHRNLRIERIVSAADIEAVEYVQPQDEWVLLVRGEATLDIAGAVRELRAGDYVFLPARTPHTVRRVSAGALWLAVHLHPHG
jgi:cupin 2 domain-containing protein